MSEQFYKFNCGCAYKVIGPPLKPDGIPFLDIDNDTVFPFCDRTWGLLARGETKGCFQIESSLGRTYTKKMRPISGHDMGTLGAILRPGVLKVYADDGKNMAEHFCLRKNNEEETPPYHPTVDETLKNTYGIICFQENSIALVKSVAGFTLVEADSIRRAIGKKKPEEMAKLRDLFMEKAVAAQIVTKEQAEEIFGWIKKGERYGFCQAHAVCYGLTGYDGAYLKAHFPLYFFTSWLKHACEKPKPLQEIYELVNDAKLYDIAIEPPDIRSLTPNFSTDGEKITFGLTDVKGIGDAQISKLISLNNNLTKKIKDLSWFEILTEVTPGISSTVVERLISVGGLRHLNIARQRMLAEYRVWSSLTEKEQAWVTTQPASASYKSLVDALKDAAKVKKEGGAAANKNRLAIIKSLISTLENPPTSLEDTPDWIAWTEEQLLGIALTCSRLDACDTVAVNCTCKEYLAGRTGYMVFGVQIEDAREVKTKKGKTPGQKMAFLSACDNSCALHDICCFPEVWKDYSHLLYKGNTVMLQAERDPKKDCLIVKKVWQLSQTQE